MSKDVPVKHAELMERAKELQQQGYAPTSPEAQSFAKDFWDYVLKTTHGNFELLNKLMDVGQTVDEKEWKENYEFDKDFMGIAIETHLKAIGFFNEANEAHP